MSCENISSSHIVDCKLINKIQESGNLSAEKTCSLLGLTTSKFIDILTYEIDRKDIPIITNEKLEEINRFINLKEFLTTRHDIIGDATLAPITIKKISTNFELSHSLVVNLVKEIGFKILEKTSNESKRGNLVSPCILKHETKALLIHYKNIIDNINHEQTEVWETVQQVIDRQCSTEEEKLEAYKFMIETPSFKRTDEEVISTEIVKNNYSLPVIAKETVNGDPNITVEYSNSPKKQYRTMTPEEINMLMTQRPGKGFKNMTKEELR